jgi:ABC-type glycerol-3-phosphate transport system permease component
MSRNRIALIFAVLFLAIALIAPIVFLFEESSAYQTDLANLGPNLADETQATNFLNNLVQRHTVALTLLVTIETVSIVLCAVSLYFALKTAEQ